MITSPSSMLSDQELSSLIRQFSHDNPGLGESMVRSYLVCYDQEDTGLQG